MALWGRRAFGRVLADSEVYDVTSKSSRLLKQVHVPSKTRNFAEAIAEALKENFAIARSPDRPSQFVSVPARDIVIAGRAVPDTFAASIAEDLTTMHGQYTPDFRVAALETSSDFDGVQVFFGRGVFAASDAPQVADLEFCATPGDTKPDEKAKPVVPMVRAQFGSGSNRAAAWYAGQLGVAIGFRVDAAPASIMPEELGEDWEPILEDLILFFGRQKESDPVIRVFHRQATNADVHVPKIPAFDLQFADWYAHDGVWQWLEINRRKLWFRITNRTGASLFLPNADLIEQRGRAIGGFTGLIIVRGLILPRQPRRLDAYTGWRVEFQNDETLRHSELTGLAWTAAAQRQYGIFSHLNGQWKGEEKSSTGEMLLPLGKKRRLELRYLDQIALKGPDASSHLKKSDLEQRDKIYGYDSLVLMYAESARTQSDSMGAFLLPTGENDADWQTLVAEPIQLRRESSGQDAEPQAVSLDWVNRAASIDGNIRLGLAEFWLDRWGLEARPTAGYLDVRVKFDRSIESYRIKNGSRGALGPLWIEYVWLDGQQESR